MAKSKATPPKTTENKSDTKNSEIDDIFATKTITNKQQDTPTLTKSQKRKQKKKAAQATETATDQKTNDSEDEHKVQEVIFAQLAAAKSLKRKTAPPPPPSSSSIDDDAFGDSRGKKAKRMTDDGYPLFDVKDLRIGEGKDTPDCPFDCQCCF
ncbi:uncharacterized protein BX664DRAFT_338974 [Halteromyces radiatus]|uniref:uncharacterized protein n=1 Tax=Halteromyces radiatus TaxID=101107 RepID=UPI00221E91CD|nr:uncharacterized protein BX664DRAFT_338974 [Halteromyces radiatus]KAI8082747.1 hypothetical protein BX664DRAFT_338974 [Halteromyces radiatus]